MCKYEILVHREVARIDDSSYLVSVHARIVEVCVCRCVLCGCILGMYMNNMPL